MTGSGVSGGLWVWAAAAIGVLACAGPGMAQGPVILETAQPEVRSQIGDESPQTWTLSDLDPDILEASVPAGARIPVCFESELARRCFSVSAGDKVDFVIRRGGVSHNTRIVGVLHIPSAVFDADYQAAHRGRVEVLVPEVYELVNIAIALTPFASENEGLVAADTAYMQRVREHFGRFRDDPFVRDVDAALRREFFSGYFGLKMNGYAFEFDARGRIQRSRVYDRTGFDGARENLLLPYLAHMQAFSDATGFRDFYAANASTYGEQIDFLQNQVNIRDMLRWLQREFPSVRPYDGVKIIFSPLVGWNQSVTRFESNGYRELQPHVNFPYPGRTGLSAAAGPVVRGEILFTELNHGFINPTADRVAGTVHAALGAPSGWATPQALTAYPNGLAVFDEYMNWGLVTLYEMDRLSEADWSASMRSTNRMMVERGFPRFEAFNAELVRLYRARRPGEPLESLYPDIIAWFARETARIAGAPPAH
ncbi:MAG: DUF4932 domain-containing protein [Caulobacteraceae bacterium]|nr:DUF4932 domain-containing protein [Caulobacteraceae bacterium]